MLENLIAEFGYFGLFIIAFLASGILPLASEVFLAAMPALGYNVWLSFLAATAGNYLGALLNYYVGLKGGEFVLSRYFKISPEQLDQANKRYERWGAPVLIMSWVPIVGDPLTIVAGVLRLDLWVYSFWIVLGKALRNLVVLGVVSSLLPYFG